MKRASKIIYKQEDDYNASSIWQKIKNYNQINTSRIFIYIITFFLLILFTGCIGVNRQFGEIKDKIMGDLGNDYKTEFQFSVGSTAITISSWFVDLAANEEYIDDMMREISSVQVGVYHKVEGSDAKANFSTLQSIDEEMHNKGWKYIVRSIDNEELTVIYLSDDPEEILNKMYVINLSNEK
ncbi:MAG: hypothetical protein ACE1ZQ_08400, partial [Ignavibacteriaceae bacterium]